MFKITLEITAHAPIDVTAAADAVVAQLSEGYSVGADDLPSGAEFYFIVAGGDAALMGDRKPKKAPPKIEDLIMINPIPR